MTDATVLTRKHWGNSLGVGLPAAIARAARLQLSVIGRSPDRKQM